MMFHRFDVIEQYRLEEPLGTGSYGMVFAAENTVSHQRCAIKFVPLGNRAGERELRALQKMQDLEHPNLLKIHHAGIFGDYLYYTMELADGKLAEQHLDPSGLLAAAIGIADALALLHAHGLIHRDVKPDNLLWREGRPLLADVGLLTERSNASLVGTAGFLPATVRSGGAELSERSDLYALAKSFYCLLSGNPPGKYPQYAGPLGRDAALLLQTVLSVCDGEPGILTAAAFRDALQYRKSPYRHAANYGVFGGILAVAAGLLVLAYWQLHSLPDEEEPRIREALRKAAAPAGAERAAILRQQAVFGELQKAAKAAMEQRYPARAVTSVEYETRRELYRQEVLQRAVQDRAEKDPEFRCFYLWREALADTASELQSLLGRPESHAELEECRRRWQRQYAEYCRERDRLLQD